METIYTFITDAGRTPMRVLPTYWTRGSFATSDSWVKVFRTTADRDREAAALRRIAGVPGVVQLKAAGILLAEREGGAPVEKPALMLTLFKGVTLLDAMGPAAVRERFQSEAVLALAKGLCTILSEVEEGREVIHNDIQPKNIIVQTDGGYALIDFGASLSGDEAPSEAHLAGVQGYWSREKREGGEITQQGDIYSFGRILRVYMDRGRELGERYPAQLERIIDRCLQEDRTERYASFTEVSADLEGIGRKSKSEPSPGREVVSLGALLTILGKSLSIATAVFFLFVATYLSFRPDSWEIRVPLGPKANLIEDCRLIISDAHEYWFK